MAITPTKTWEYSVNHSFTGTSVTDRNRQMWLRLKEMLTDTGSPGFLDVAGGALANLTAPWTVIYSSDGSTASNGDLWSVKGDIVGSAAGNPHSWIHLRQVDYFGSGDHLNLLLSVEDVATCAVGLVAYARGPLGWNADGTINNRPTLGASSIEFQVRDGLVTTGTAEASDVMWGDDALNDTRVLQFRISDDGKCGWWATFSGGKCYAFAGWQEDEGGPARVNPFCAWYASKDDTQEINVWTAGWNSQQYVKTWDESDLGISLWGGCSMFGASEVAMMTMNDGTDGTRFFGPIHLASITTNTVYGVMTDMWWGSDSDNSGDGSPVAPPVTFRQVGVQIMPWPSGTAMTVS